MSISIESALWNLTSEWNWQALCQQLHKCPFSSVCIWKGFLWTPPWNVESLLEVCLVKYAQYFTRKYSVLLCIVRAYVVAFRGENKLFVCVFITVLVYNQPFWQREQMSLRCRLHLWLTAQALRSETGGGINYLMAFSKSAPIILYTLQSSLHIVKKKQKNKSHNFNI